MTYAKYIDHTLLKPNATKKEIETLCQEAKIYHFASVCVNPCWVSYCHELLKDTDVKVCTVIGFPLGATPYVVKGYETKTAIEDGADEIDMVINIGALKDRNLDLVKRDIEEVVSSANGRVVQVIIETCLLGDEELFWLVNYCKQCTCNICKTHQLVFLQVVLQFRTVRLMKQTVGDACQVKASGGIRTFEDMKAMIDAGASRIWDIIWCKTCSKLIKV